MTRMCPHCGQAMQAVPSPNGIIVDEPARRFGRAGKWVTLTNCEWRIFSALLRGDGEAVSNRDVEEATWPGQSRVGINLSRRRMVLMNRLRGKFCDVGLTVINDRGLGYRLVEMVA